MLEPGLFTGKVSAPSSGAQITEYQESEMVEVHDVSENNLALARNFMNPFPDQTPKALVERSYLVNTTVWNIATPLFYSLEFPKLLVPFVDPVLLKFIWMRAEVEIEMKINTTPLMQGAICVSWLPNHLVTSLKHRTGFRQRSANNPMIISLATQNGLKFTIPWLNPLNYFIRAQSSSTYASAIGLVDVEGLFGTTTTPDAPTTVKIMTYARFKNVELAGYQEAQSEAVTKSIKGVVDGVKTASSLVKSVFSMAPVVGNLISMVGAFDKPTSVAALQPVIWQPSRGMANGDGLDVGQTLSIDPNPMVSTEGYIIGNPDHIVPLQRIICTPMISGINTFDNTVNKNYLESVVPIPDGMVQPDYLAFVANMFQFWRGSIKYLIQFYCSPLISARFMIRLEYNSGATVPGETGDYISKVIDVKGDTEVSFTVPYLFPTPYRPCVGVSGVTQYPRLRVYLINDIVGMSTDSTPLVHMVCWRSGGEDMAFSCYKTPYFKMRNDPSFQVAQSDPVSKFKEPFETIIGSSVQSTERNFIRTEDYKTCNQLWHRFVTKEATSTTDPTIGWDCLAIWSEVFKHWRGGRRMKIFSPGIDPETGDFFVYGMQPEHAGTLGSHTVGGNGIAVTNSDNKFLEILVPYYSECAFALCENNGVGYGQTWVDGNVHSGSVDNSAVYIAGADDFSYGYLYAPSVWVDPRSAQSSQTNKSRLIMKKTT